VLKQAKWTNRTNNMNKLNLLSIVILSAGIGIKLQAQSYFWDLHIGGRLANKFCGGRGVSECIDTQERIQL